MTSGVGEADGTPVAAPEASPADAAATGASTTACASDGLACRGRTHVADTYGDDHRGDGGIGDDLASRELHGPPPAPPSLGGK